MNDRDNQSGQFTELVKKMISTDPPEEVQGRMDDMLKDFRTELSGHSYVRKLERRKSGAAATPALFGLRLAPLPVAAGVLAVVLIILGSVSLLRPRMVPIVWAEVADRVAEIDRLMFSMDVRVVEQKRGRGGEKGMEPAEGATMTFYMSSAYGFRWDVLREDQTLMSFYVPTDGDSMVIVSHEERNWARFPVDRSGAERSPLSPEEDPDEYIRRFLARGYMELGRSEIDGVTVEGIEVINPPVGTDSYLEGTGRLWVEVDSNLPIRLELSGVTGGQTVEWKLDFRWGDQVDIEEFAPVIPPGFSPTPPDNLE